MLPAVRAGRHPLKRLLAALVTVALALTGILALAGPSQAATQGPYDIYAAGGTPCAAAHSTTRALYAAYKGQGDDVCAVAVGICC